MKKSKRLAAWLFLMLCCAPAANAACEVRAFDDRDYTVCAFDPAADDIRLFRADETGTFRGQCAELCGKDHGYMPIVVDVVEEAEYQAWLDSQRNNG